MDKQAFITQLETQLEEQIALVAHHFQNKSDAELKFKTNEYSWSISECFDHLNSYARYYLPQLMKELEHQTPSKPEAMYKARLIGKYLIKSVDVNQSRKKLKTIAAHQPIITESGFDIIQHHLSHQENLLQLLAIARHSPINQPKIKTSLSRFIKLRQGEAFHFLITHTERHLQQALAIPV